VSHMEHANPLLSFRLVKTAWSISSCTRLKVVATNFATMRNSALSTKRTSAPGDGLPYDFGFIPSTLADDGDPVDYCWSLTHPLLPRAREESFGDRTSHHADKPRSSPAVCRLTGARGEG
jgi:hypothetical protein